MKRICIYVVFDKKNIVDEYIAYMLSQIKPNVERLVVVCNQTRVEKGYEYLEQYADEVYLRENKGLDVGAFKDALCDLVGWCEIKKYDELLLINDSFFGPFVPFETILHEMEMKEVDFWGIMEHAEMDINGDRHIPAHLQSYFIAIQANMLHSDAFMEYWISLPYFPSYNIAIEGHELKFTQYFADRGFKYAALADSSANSSVNPKNNYNQYVHIPYELIKKRNFPFLKKQQLAFNTLHQHTQENYLRAIKYIEQNTNYDVNLIWDNIIRTLNINDLYRNFHFLYIIGEETTIVGDYKDKAVIIITVSNMSAIESVLEYISQINGTVEIFVIPTNQEIATSYREQGYKVVSVNKSCYQMLDVLNQYEYICFLNDEDLSSEKRSSYVGKSQFFNIWGNLVGDGNYINSVINKLEKETKLGILLPPAADFGVYFGSQTCNWEKRYDDVHKIIDEHSISCICSREKAPFVISESLWIKKEVLKRISEFGADEISLIKYLWIYLAQEQGYYAGVVESEEYASLSQINKDFYIKDLLNQVSKQYGDSVTYFDFKKYIFAGAVKIFCEKCKYIYVYGIGYMAKEYTPYISCINGYIVSDGQCNPREFQGKKVFFLSEVQDVEEMGVVVCLDKKYQEQIILMLKEKGIKNYICI